MLPAGPGLLVEWLQYRRLEGSSVSCPKTLAHFWSTRAGALASRADFLIHLAVTLAEVERSFSLAGNMDTKYRHALPNEKRHITIMMMCNGDIEHRFD